MLSADREFVTHRPDFGSNLVKSAERVIQILELFDDLKSCATVADIADKLNYPQSSTSALLRSLVVLGYLSHDAHSRVYMPTSRVALLGSWINPLLVKEGPILRALQEISQRTGLPSHLVTRNKLYLQIIRFEYGADTPIYMGTGSGRLMVSAASGSALMSGMTNAEIARIVIATNAQLDKGQNTFALSHVMANIEAVRRDGYAVGAAARSEQATVVAIPLHCGMSEPTALGVGIESGEHDPAPLAELMHAAVNHSLATDQ
jgi:DNA-binding IclR family transcriptional regulator